MIKKIKLVNWKSHLDSEFRFSQGVNVLVGIMGSGKSSVMQAISFALFGTFPALQSRKVSLDEMIMSRPQKMNRAEVQLTFSLDENEYCIMRAIERGKGTVKAEIRKNGRLINVNPQGVTEEVERILQMDYELFSKAVYAEQNNLDYFLKIPKGQRIEHIDRMLKLDRFERVRENAVSLTNRVRQSARDLKRIVEDMEKENLEKKIQMLDEEIKTLNQDKDCLEASLQKIDNEVLILTSKISELEKTEEELHEITKTLEGLNSSIKEIEKSLIAKKEKLSGKKVDEEGLKSIDEKIKELEEELKLKREKEKAQREELASLQTKISVLRAETEELKKEIAEKEKPSDIEERVKNKLGERPEEIIEQKESQLKSLKEQLYSMKAEKENLQKSTLSLKDAREKCPVCESEISREKKERLLREREKQIGEIEKNITETEGKIALIQNFIEEARIILAEFQNYQEIKKSIVEARKKLQEMEEEIVKLENLKKESERKSIKIKEILEQKEKFLKQFIAKKEEMKAIVEEISHIKEMESRLREKKIQKEMLSEKEKTLSSKLKEHDLKELRSRLQENIAEKSKHATKIKNIEEMIKEKEERKEEYKKRFNLLKKYKTEVKTSNEIVKKLELFTEAVKITQDQLREEFLKTVNAIMNEIWQEIYPYQDFQGIRLVIDKDYTLQLKTSDGWVNVEGIVSGGERSIASLVLRIAFSLAFIPNLKWLILDEPTHNLDTNAIEKFNEILRERMHSFADQVFIITHEERLAEATTGSVYKLERDKEMNGPTIVREA